MQIVKIKLLKLLIIGGKKMKTLAEVTNDTRTLYKKLHNKGIKPIGKKEVYREVPYYRVKKRLTKKKKYLVNVYRDEDLKEVL